MQFGLRHRPFTLAATLLGVVAAGLAWGFGAPAPTAVLIGWCGFVLGYAVPTFRRMRQASPVEIRERAELLDEGEGAVLAASLGAALASLGAVGWSLIASPGPADAGAVAMALITIVLSWSFVHLLFAVRYAHEYWQCDGGLEFPGREPPDFIDFLYYSFTIGMTFQTSDVEVSHRLLRQLTLIHALVAFVFNVVIVAAAVNVAAGLVG